MRAPLSVCLRLSKCRLLCSLHGLRHGRDGEDDQGEDGFRTDVNQVVNGRVGCRIPTLPGILAEKYPAAEEGKEEASHTGCQVTEPETVLLIGEKAGKSEGAEGEDIIQHGLHRRQHIGIHDELQNTVGHAGDDAHQRTEEKSRQHRKEHGAEGNGASCRKGEELDHGSDRGQCDAHGAVNENLDIF